MTRTVVLLNPRAAAGRAAALRQPLATWLARNAPAVTLLETTDIADARRAARELPRAARIVVVGGDGTLHHLLEPALDRDHSVALVPLGSGNDSARALGLFPLDWKAAIAHALHAPTVAIDTGALTVGGRRVPFVSSLCAGFDAAVCARVAAAPAWLGGMPRYLWSTLGELAHLRTWDLKVTLDGALRHAGAALFASTCNTPTFGSGMPAVPHAVVADGRLDLLLAGAFGRVGALRMLPRLLHGSHLRDARVSTWAFERLRVESGQAIPLAADGEPLDPVASFEVRVMPRSLAFVVGPGPAALGNRKTVTSIARSVPA
jgi:diacylglycerol kinase (ATP)